MREIKVLFQNLEIDSLPSEKIIYEEGKLCIYFNDIYENRYKIRFMQHQAMKITMMDCLSAMDFYTPYGYRNGSYHRYILQIENSEWIAQLSEGMKEVDERCNGLIPAKHFMIHLGEDIVEVIAWDIKVEKIED